MQSWTFALGDCCKPVTSETVVVTYVRAYLSDMGAVILQVVPEE